MSLEVMKQALGALEKSVSTCFDRYAHEQVMSRPEHFINQAITALRLAIEQAERLEKDPTKILATEEMLNSAGFYRRQPMVVSQECAERGCVAHDDRVDGPGVVIEQAEKQEPVAYVSGYYAGRCVIEPLNRAMVMPDGMALYTAPPQRQPLTEIAEALRRHGLTLVQTAKGYDVMRLGEITAHGIGGEK